jgi:N-acetylmuramoyl-L-alanine amidase
MKRVFNYIPIGIKRNGGPIVPTAICIHNTGNSKSTARNERNWLTNPANVSSIGYHIVIDEKEVIYCVPLQEIMYHAGSVLGNTQSIGIEICESGDFDKTMRNAVAEVKLLMGLFGIPAEKVVQHNFYNKKDCPRLLRAGYAGWDWERFKKEII